MGCDFTWRHVTDAVEIRELLKEKLEDELDELAQEEYLSIEKYADVLEVLYELMHCHHIDRHEVNDVRLTKDHREYQIQLDKYGHEQRYRTQPSHHRGCTYPAVSDILGLPFQIL